jgi:hypothetical protein
MIQPPRIIIPIAEVRFNMKLALTTFQRSRLAILGSPQGRLKDEIRSELVEALTIGWEAWRIERALEDHERPNLPVLLTLGRAALSDDKA